MVPRTLVDWSVSTVIELLSTGMFETDRFDYKQSLPPPQDNGGKDRLRRTCCAFANSDGGFLVFGISDDRTAASENRLIGCDSYLDFPQQCGNYPGTCYPAIEWSFLNPPLTLASGNVLHVIAIPKSWKAPHATGDRDAGWRFAKRTNQGDEGMTIEEVRSAFLGLYEKRLKLQLLQAELLTLEENAHSACLSNEADIRSSFSLVTFDMQVIESIVVDTYSITTNDTAFLQALSAIRQVAQVAKVANNKTHTLFGAVHLPLSNKRNIIKKHNEFMRPKCERLIALCDVAIARLNSLLGI
jgi:predicted HTH transcriptional regulator